MGVCVVREKGSCTSEGVQFLLYNLWELSG